MGNKNDLINKRKVEIEEAKEKCWQLNITWEGEFSVKTNSQEDFIKLLKKFIFY